MCVASHLLGAKSTTSTEEQVFDAVKQTVVECIQLGSAVLEGLSDYPHEAMSTVRACVSSRLNHLARSVPLHVVHNLWMTYDLAITAKLMECLGIDPELLVAHSLVDDPVAGCLTFTRVVLSVAEAMDMLMSCPPSECPALSWHFWVCLLGPRFGGLGMGSLAVASLGLRLGICVNMGTGGASSSAYMRSALGSEIFAPEHATVDLSDSASSIGGVWGALARVAFQDPGHSLTDYTGLAAVPVLANNAFFDIGVLMRCFRCTVETTEHVGGAPVADIVVQLPGAAAVDEGADDLPTGPDLAFVLDSHEAALPAKAPVPACTLLRNRASRTLSHLFQVQLRGLLLLTAPNDTARAALDSDGHIGVRDVLTMVPSFSTAIPRPMMVFFARRKLGLTDDLRTQEVSTQCARCGSELPVEERGIPHAAACRKLGRFRILRHNEVRDLLSEAVAKDSEFCSRTEQVVGVRRRRPGPLAFLNPDGDGKSVVRSDVTVIGPFSDHVRRHEIDILVEASICKTHTNTHAQRQLDDGRKRKVAWYKGAELFDDVDEVVPFVFLDNGALDYRANTWLYQLFRAQSPAWLKKHILLSLSVQRLRASLARTVLGWTYLAYRSTLYSNLRSFYFVVVIFVFFFSTQLSLMP